MNLVERLDPSLSALIIVDVQNDFCHPDGKRGKDVKNMIPLVDRINRLSNAAREQGLPVIFIRTEHSQTLDSPAWLGRLGKSIDPSMYIPNCQPDTWGAEFFKIQPLESDIIITKNRYSAFVGTNLNLILQTFKRTSLLFTGVATNICVETSLRDAVSHDYYATLVDDCCATFSEEAQQSTIKNVESQFGYVAASDKIIDIWKR